MGSNQFCWCGLRYRKCSELRNCFPRLTEHTQSASTVLAFYLTMIMNPEVQRKAQAEIDSVVGTDRLPAITDRSSLPYIRSIMAEVLRWHPPVPLGK